MKASELKQDGTEYAVGGKRCVLVDKQKRKKPAYSAWGTRTSTREVNVFLFSAVESPDGALIGVDAADVSRRVVLWSEHVADVAAKNERQREKIAAGSRVRDLANRLQRLGLVSPPPSGDVTRYSFESEADYAERVLESATRHLRSGYSTDYSVVLLPVWVVERLLASFEESAVCASCGENYAPARRGEHCPAAAPTESDANARCLGVLR